MRRFFSNRLDRFEAVDAFSDDLHTGLRAQVLAQHLPGRHLIVDDGDAKKRHTDSSTGSEITARKRDAEDCTFRLARPW